MSPTSKKSKMVEDTTFLGIRNLNKIAKSYTIIIYATCCPKLLGV